MTTYLSKKLTIISLMAMLMVVLLHAQNTEIKFTSNIISLEKGYSFFIQEFFSQGITRTAVPIFFIISGYLFFLNFKGTSEAFITKYKSRFKSLVVPYLSWSIWGLLFYFTMQLVPFSKAFFTKDLIADYTTNQFLNALLLEPIPYQLWFLRDLIVLVALSPLIYGAIRYLKAFPILLFLGLWLIDFKLVIVENESLLFFALGAYLSIKKSDWVLKNLGQQNNWLWVGLWLLLVLTRTALVYLDFENVLVIKLVLQASILAGLVSIWSLYDMLMKDKTQPSPRLQKLAVYAFFLYAFHEPLLTIINKALFYVVGKGEFPSLCIYVIAPILDITICVFVGFMLKKILPNVYGFLTGGR